MSFGAQASRTRTHTWLESLGEWSWPGSGAATADFQPPSWVPAFPPRPVPAAAAPTAAAGWQRQRVLPRRLGAGVVLSALAALCVAVAVNGPAGVERLVGVNSGSGADVASIGTRVSSPTPPLLPALTSVSHDGAGSSIDTASYSSPALQGSGSFLVYLPPGYASTDRRYPVLYLLHGTEQPASAFLQIGLQRELDRLIAHHAIPPLIAVMIQGARGRNNWRNRYESYILEVQELVDRMLPTVASRAGRAVAGDSMGGYGAMHVALDNPYRFSVVESWLGFYVGLGEALHADRPVISRLGLHAFIYGGQADRIVNAAEDPAFADSLRAAGADAKGLIYPGGHSLETLQEHLDGMLKFAGHNLAAPRPLASR
jgi:S-formylglutathione hydrolase FrmB